MDALMPRQPRPSSDVGDARRFRPRSVLAIRAAPTTEGRRFRSDPDAAVALGCCEPGADPQAAPSCRRSISRGCSAMNENLSDKSVMLSKELLEDPAARWRRQDMPIAGSLRPGLSDAEMDPLTEPLGIRLPREARTWWGWHDGAWTDGKGSSNLGPLRLYSRSPTPSEARRKSGRSCAASTANWIRHGGIRG